MKKLLSMLGAMGLVATSSATVVSCGGKDKDVDTTKLDLSVFTGDKAILVVYSDTTTAPAPKDILDAFNEKNNLTLELETDVSVATATGASPTYTATIEATKDSKTALNKIDVTVTVAAPINLTTFKGDKAKLTGTTFEVVITTPNAQFILDAFNKKNELKLVLTTEVTIDNIKLEPTSVKSEEPTSAVFTATINAISGLKNVLGSVDVSITVTPKPKANLSEITGDGLNINIPVKNIIDEPNEGYILKFFSEKNNLTLRWNDEDAEVNLDNYKTPDESEKTYTYTVTITAGPESRVATGQAIVSVTLTLIEQ